MERILTTLKMTPALPGKSGRGLARSSGRATPSLRSRRRPPARLRGLALVHAAAILNLAAAPLRSWPSGTSDSFHSSVRESQSWWASVERWVAVKASKKKSSSERTRRC